MIKIDQTANQREILDRIILKSEICHLASRLDGKPYLIPLSFGYDGECLYFHTSQSGKKIAAFEQDPKICLNFVTGVQLDSTGDQACSWDFHYQSAIIDGIIEEVTSLTEKRQALEQITNHYGEYKLQFPEKKVNAARAWRVRIKKFTIKLSP
jgi:nitroimidazol reductase NimA-like FMN-containing flavoprotein (pyridoxamine 5'-phosphate oxidase superfamily)